MRLAVYIRELGGEPAKLRGSDYRGWERELQKQYQQLRENLGKEAGQAARVRGRAIIRRRGLSAAVAALLPPPMGAAWKLAAGPRATVDEAAAQTMTAVPAKTPANSIPPLISPQLSVCQRKYRHPDFLSAMLHARRIQSHGLRVYPCDLCGGLHVGHDPESEETQRARVRRKRLRSIDRQLAAMAEQGEELRRERQNLLAEQGAPIGSPRSRLRQFVLRIEAWLATLE